MLYIIEVYRRILYVVLSFIGSFLCFYLSKHLFTIFLFSNTFYKTNIFIPSVIEKSFLINLTETLITVEILLSSILAVMVTLPILIYTTKLFAIPGLSLIEYNSLYFHTNTFLINLYLWNYTVFLQMALQFWCFSENLNAYLISNNYLTIEYEPDLVAYFSFIYLALKMFNTIYLIFFGFYMVFKRKFFKIFLEHIKILKPLFTFVNVYALLIISSNNTLLILISAFILFLTHQLFNALKLLCIFKHNLTN